MLQRLKLIPLRIYIKLREGNSISCMDLSWIYRDTEQPQEKDTS